MRRVWEGGFGASDKSPLIAIRIVSARPATRAEYKASDFPKLVRGKYAEQLSRRSNVVIVDPELVDLFPHSEAVNAALRSLSEIARRARSQQPV